MPFNEQLPEWNATGVEPPLSKKTNGWQPGEKPPADWWNWLLNRIFKVVKELQQKSEDTSKKGQANGYASLDVTGKVPAGQLPPAAAADWNTLQNKPSAFAPTTHAASHKTGGSDPILPSDIGAETPAGATSKANAAVSAHVAAVDPHPQYATDTDLSNHISDYVRQPGYAAATGLANAYAVTLNPTPAAYIDGMAVAVKINVANTSTSTINVNGLGAKAIKKANGTDVGAGNLRAGGIYTLRYDGTAFILQGEGGEPNVKSIQRGYRDLTGTSTHNITITSVDLNKSIVRIYAVPSASSSFTTNTMAKARLTSSTNIEIVIGNYDKPPRIYWEVIEFNNVKSLQKGAYTLVNPDGTSPLFGSSVNVSTVDINKSMLFFSFFTSNSGAIATFLSGTVLTSNLISFVCSWPNSTYNIEWQLIEFE